MLALRQFTPRAGERALMTDTFAGGLLAIVRDPLAVRFPFGRLRLGPLTPRDGVALTLFGDGHLRANLLYLFALNRDET